MSRNVPFDPNAHCQNCGKVGSFDFMGDMLCADCAFSVERDEHIAEIK